MFLITITALAAVCGAAKLDRAYLPPPPSAKTAGGSPGSLQTPLITNDINQRIAGVPKGGYTNDLEGVVVEAVAPGTRASSPDDTNLGAARLTYGSIYSKVGDEAFKPDPVGGISQFSKDAYSKISKESVTANYPEINERPQASQDRLAETVKSESALGPDSFRYSFETNNGISAEENAVESDGIKASGHFQYKSDDGQIYSVSYTADENGYRPVGDHLPTPPPIPKEILKSLEQNAREEAAGIVDDGSYNAQKYNTGSDYNRGDTNGQYNDKHLFNTEQRPQLLANGEVINQNNQGFGTQKITEVQFGYTPNLNEFSNENNNFIQDKSKKDNTAYKNQYTFIANNVGQTNFRESPASGFASQHQVHSAPIVNVGHYETQIKSIDQNSNLPFGAPSKSPSLVSATVSSQNHEQVSKQSNNFQENSQILSANFNQASNIHNLNRENPTITIASNRINQNNDVVGVQKYSDATSVNSLQSIPSTILTTPQKSNFGQISEAGFQNNIHELQNGNYNTVQYKSTQSKTSALTVPNVIYQRRPGFNSYGAMAFNKASELAFKVNHISQPINERNQGNSFQSQINDIGQISALPMNLMLPSHQSNNHLGFQKFGKAPGVVNLQSNKFPFTTSDHQTMQQTQPNYAQGSSQSSSEYTGEIYQYNKPPENIITPPETENNSKLTGELYVYNKPLENLQPSSDSSLKNLHNTPTTDISLKSNINQQNSRTEEYKQPFMQSSKILPGSNLFIPTISEKKSGKLTLEHGSQETQSYRRSQFNEHQTQKDLSQSTVLNENQQYATQYQGQFDQNFKSPTLSKYSAGTTVGSLGEVFGGPREIPRFDTTGYHY